MVPETQTADHKFLNLRTVLSEADLALKASLAARSASPFIAHHVVSDAGREAINGWMDLAGLSAYQKMAEKWPALAAWALADYISQHYGEESNNAVYIHIQDFLGEAQLTPAQRQSLHKFFRQACSSLGLTLPAKAGVGEGPNVYVRDYIIQAGASLSQLEALATAFVAAEEVYGRPPIDDMLQLNTWEDEGVCNFLSQGLTRLRDIILFDPTGYHAAVYLRLRDGGRASTPFEEKFKQAIQQVLSDVTRRKKRQALLQAPPYMALLDTSLCLVNPPGSEDIKIKCNEKEHLLPRSGVWTIPQPSPSVIEWTPAFSKGGEKAKAYISVMPDDPFALLVFQAKDGKLKPTKPYSENGREVIELDLGEYAFLGKQAFKIGNDESHKLGNGHLIYRCLVGPTEVVFSERRIILKPTPKVGVLIVGSPVLKVQGISLVAGAIQAHIAIPDELRNERLELVMEHPSICKPVRREILLAEAQQTFSVDMNSFLPASGALGMLRLSVVLQGQERPLASTACYFWPGLKTLREGRFFEGPVPSNYDDKTSKHIVISSGGHLSLRADEDYPSAKLSFRPSIAFEVVNPGISACIVNPDSTQQLIPRDTEIALGDNLDHSILIRCGNPVASLDICGEVEAYSFAKSAYRRLPLSALRREGEHDEVRVIISGISVPLFRVVHSAEPRQFKETLQDENTLVVTFSTHIEIDAVRITAKNLNTAKDAEIYEADASQSNPFFILELDASQKIVTIKFNAKSWNTGLWLVNFGIKDLQQQRWRPMKNMDSEVFSIVFSVVEGEFNHAPPLPLKIEEAFYSVCVALSMSHATNVSKNLVPVWKKLGQTLIEQRQFSQILASIVIAPPPGSRAGWITRSHPLEFMDTLFSVDTDFFQGLLSRQEDGAHDLGNIVFCKSLDSAGNSLAIAPYFWPSFAKFGPNLTSLGKFSFEKYERFLIECKPTDPFGRFWDISRDELLSLAHHNMCWRRAAARIRSLMKDMEAGETNQILANLKLLRNNVPHLKSVVLAAQYERVEVDDAAKDIYGEFDICENLPAAFSILAFSFRRGSEHIKKLWSELAAKTGLSPTIVIKRTALVMRASTELFAFYLLLWELVLKGEGDERR